MVCMKNNICPSGQIVRKDAYAAAAAKLEDVETLEFAGDVKTSERTKNVKNAENVKKNAENVKSAETVKRAETVKG